MARLIYPIRPVQHAISTENPALFVAQGFAPWVSNGRIDQNSFKKRWGYSLYRSPLSYVYDVILYQTIAGSRHTLYLTANDLILKESSGTFSYKTPTSTTPSLTSMNGGKTVMTFSGGGITASGVAALDKFIIDADHTATSEIDANWATVVSKDSDTQITTAAYTGAATSGACKLRKIYTVPNNERWSYAIVDDKFCFTNGNENVQYWAGTGYAADLNATYAVKARYCIEYANRLFLADTYVSNVRLPTTLLFSKEGDPTDWTDSTAGEMDLLETDDYITGLGKVGFNLVVYKEDSILVFSRTGNATAPISRTAEWRGIGCPAPYSIIGFMGTNAFLGRDDFYIMSGDQPEPIGGPIRDKFFSMVGKTEIKKTFSGSCPNINELYWTVNTVSDGQITFIWNYK